jgi:hypothetical protein
LAQKIFYLVKNIRKRRFFRTLRGIWRREWLGRVIFRNV